MSTVIAPITPNPAARTAIALGTIDVAWSTTFFGIRLALDGFPPLVLGAVRFLLAALLLVVAAETTRAPRPDRREIAGAGVVGVVALREPMAASTLLGAAVIVGSVALVATDGQN